MRRLLRKLLTAIASILALVVLYPVASEFFIELAREWKWYDQPSQRLGAAMDAFSSVVTQTWFIGLATLFVGLAIGMWLDVFLRRRETAPINAVSETAMMARGVEANSLSLEYRPDFNHQRDDESGEPWITVRIKFQTPEMAQNARPWLYSVKRYENGQWSSDMLSGMQVILSWPGSGNRFEPRCVYDEQFILLFDYDVISQVLSVVTDTRHTPLSLRDCLAKVQPGEYLLSVGVETGNLGKIEAAFLLDWFGNIESMRLRLAPADL